MSADLIGAVVNGYEILSQVGQGGMATVYLARQQSMKRNVALKFLPSAYLNDELYLQRFAREVEIVAKLEHRNIVPVYDFGEHRGQPYIAMRYMPAGSVEAQLSAGRIALPRVLSIVEQVASALDYAHQHGVLHRDLKPSNILLDDGGGAFITDFGIARILSEGGGKITTEGVVGTPSYMSPEQAQGEPLDARSDVYALGVMLYELAAGRRPFVSDTPYSIAVMHVTMPPPSPRQFEPGLSLELEQVIMRALSKRPQDRYASGGELAAALRNAMASQTGALPAMPATPGSVRAEQSQRAVATGGWTQTLGPGPSTAHTPPRSRRVRPVRSGRMWLGMAAGGALGCGLLLAVLAVALSLLGAYANQAPATVTTEPGKSSLDAADSKSQVIPADPLRSTLNARNARADATFTADASRRQADRPSATAEIQPVGVRDGSALSGALHDAGGELVYFAPVLNASEAEPEFAIVSLNLETGETRALTTGGSFPQASSDGRWIAFQSSRDGDEEIYVMNRLGGQLRQLTLNDRRDRLPAWSPDGEWIVYAHDARGDETYDLYRVRLDGSAAQPMYSDGWRNSHARYNHGGSLLVFTAGPELRDARSWELRLMELPGGATRLLTQNDVRDASPVFSPDGMRILYVTTIGGVRALASMDLAGGDRQILYSAPGSVWAASYSPDGHFIVVTATIDGLDQLLIMPAQGGAAQQITTAGGAYASWLEPIR